MKPYNKSNIPLAKELRKNMTPWERHLWYDFLRNYPVRFQRQKAIGDYIVDFYCAKARLVIELDGGGHYEPEQMQADQRRTEDLESMDLRVVRICNLDIDKNFAGVCEYIDMVVRESLPLMRKVAEGRRERGIVSPPVSFADSPLVRGGLADTPSSEGALVRKVIALGFFDGVHLGHQALLLECCRIAREQNAKPCAITFQQHPQSLFTENPPKLINTEQTRRELLRAYGIGPIYSYPVVKEIMTMPWQAFLEGLVGFGAVGFVCGKDFRFGNRGEGDAEKLAAFCQERGLLCKIIGEQTLDGTRVSSTHIRTLLEKGEMDRAVRFLGHPHMVSGKVVQGRQLGRTLGIPTANLALAEDVVTPRFGVYACKATVEGRSFLAVTNVGMRPTVGGENITVEPWILDFDGDLYGQELTLEFYAFLRPEKKFDSLEELAAEIRVNAEQTRRLLG